MDCQCCDCWLSQVRLVGECYQNMTMLVNPPTLFWVRLGIREGFPRGGVTVFICNIHVHILLDPSAIHPFVSSMFIAKLDKMLEPLPKELVIYTLVGDALLVSEMLRDCDVSVEGVNMTMDLLPLELQELNVILGMDFLSTHYASMDCYKKGGFS